MLFNGEFKKLKALYFYGQMASIDSILMCIGLTCPKLQFFECECKIDKQKDFPQMIIKALFDNLTELKAIKIGWKNATQTDNPAIVKSEMEEILGNCKNKFKIDIGKSNQDWIRITRDMWIQKYNCKLYPWISCKRQS